MKFIRAEKDQLIFGLNPREKIFLCKILGMFPLVPPAHYRLSKAGRGKSRLEDQRLLEESLADQRGENAKRVQVFLKQPERFQNTGDAIQFSLKRTEIEWFLQVLNDVRVGAWLALGEPDESVLPTLNETNAHLVFALEVSGYFQGNLLAALEHLEPT